MPATSKKAAVVFRARVQDNAGEKSKLEEEKNLESFPVA
jgi:hypothetical protein